MSDSIDHRPSTVNLSDIPTLLAELRAGRPVILVDDEGREVPRGTLGRLAVQGPLGCRYLADPDRAVLIAVSDTRILGYTMMIHGVPDDPEVSKAVVARPSVELSKMYVVPESHGGGVAAALMNTALDHAGTLAAASVWLGVNQRNARAQRFYAKYGFAITGTKTFRLGEHVEADYVMVRPV